MATATEVKTRMTPRERREYRELRIANHPAVDAKGIARATTALRKAADSCLKELPR